MNKEELINGISAYSREQKVLLRLIRKKNGLTESKFDELFRGREFRRPMKLSPIAGDSFLLGLGINGFNEWAWWLDLLQQMMTIGLVITERDENNKIIYLLG